MLDPAFQFLSHHARKGRDLTDMTPVEARQATRDGIALVGTDINAGVTFEDQHITLPGRNLPIRIYRPQGQKPDMPVIVYYHSGGGVVGGLDSSHTYCAQLSAICKAPVVSVDYRLAPEDIWPAGLDDATEA